MSDSCFRQCGNLPPELRDFIGRARLLTNLEKRLDESRLVTLTGLAGVGKSRAALRLAHVVRSRYRDGVWHVDLGRLRDADMIRHAIASALGLADQSMRSDLEALARWMSKRHVLLVLDTCEHLVRGCAEVVHELLEAAPNLKVLATSRQPLHLPNEHVVLVPPLKVPGDDPAESPSANESVQLFNALASVGVPDFAQDNIATVVELCRRLDGIPLAIELAAIRLRELPIEQMPALMADRFDLLVNTAKVEPARHQTLRAAISWSHELCEPAERLLWARLSVFARDFELDAAEIVCSDQGLPMETVSSLLSGLVEKSILLYRNDQENGRYKLVDALAEYGGEWLHELGQSEQLRQRHLEYYTSLAQRSEDAWSGPRQIYWFVRMRQEYQNVRTALEYALRSAGRKALALRLLSSLWFMWVCCGFARDGRKYLEQALEPGTEPSKERCKALWVLSYVCSAQGDSEGAQNRAETCLEEAAKVGDSRAAMLASKMQGTAALLQGDLNKAGALLGMALEFNTDCKELNPGLLPAVVESALVLTAQGEVQEAEALLQDCLQMCRERGEQWVSSHAHWALAGGMLATGRVEDALLNVRKSLRIKRLFHDTLGTLLALETSVRIFVELGQLPLAVQLVGALEHNWHAAGEPQMGAPWVAEHHKTCQRDCRRRLGDSAYKNAFEEGARLDLDQASALALGEWNIPESTALEIRVTDGSDDAFAKVEDAVVQVAGAFGFDVPTAHRSHNERYVMKFRAATTGRTADEQLEEMDRALRDETPRRETAQFHAVDALITVLEKVNRAVVMVEQTLLVKVNGHIVPRRLSVAEQAYLDNHRHLFNKPADLLHELDQLKVDSTPGSPRQVKRNDREIIVEHLGESAAQALDAWAATGSYEITVNRPVWAKSGYTESRLLALIVRTPPDSDQRTSKVIAKSCPPGPPSREPMQHQRAWNASPGAFRREHLVALKPHSPAIGGAGGYVLLQEVAGGSFATLWQMAELESPGEIVAAFNAVTHGLIRKWNKKQPDPYSHIDSGEYLRSELREKFGPQGKLRAWAQQNGLLRPDRRWIMFADDSNARLLPNPLAMAAGDIVAQDHVQHLRGLTHGDLHTGNVLLQRTRQGELLPQRFRLVDLTTFDSSAPLTRDPAMLLLSIVAKRIPPDASAQEELFDQIIRGEGRHDLFAPLMRVIRDADAQLITDDFREDWINQLPLSLLATALLHCTFGNLDERTCWWFFRLAARCGAEYLHSTDSWPSSNPRPSVLGLGDMGGFRMPPHPQAGSPASMPSA
ncbi:AAA family ATPase [Nonomuraea sp. PA05]|uniref:ATP-binding protein n=1 Tax=Nonomuraea sp. PA05 TaxID=2604466 RepID=UPI0011DA9F1D|nr:AAA family ATPase [Nonomuraea sp. PA05]TYB68926.1 AAA family ATPase [Nonomuraea sp. PA05]